MPIYPGSVPEFRIVLKKDNSWIMQIRYIKDDVNYKSDWFDVPIVKEE